MYVEDAIRQLAKIFSREPPIDEWSDDFVRNVASYVNNGSALTTEQARIVLKLVDRYHDVLMNNGIPAEHIRDLLNHPRYHKPLIESINVPREVRYLGDNKLGFRFKMDKILINRIKGMPGPKFEMNWPWYHRKNKIWVVSVTADNLTKVENIIAQFHFAFDDDVVDFLTECHSLLEHEKKGESRAVMDETGLAVIQALNDDPLAWWVAEVLEGERI